MIHPDQAQPTTARGPLAAIFLTILIDLIGFSIIFPLLPSILDWYIPHAAPDSLLGQINEWLQKLSPASEGGKVISYVLIGGVIGSIFSVLQFISSPVWGRLSDRLGRRRILLITTTLTSSAYLIWFFSGNLWLFLLSRTCCGLMAGNISVASAAVADVTSAKARSKGMALIGIAFATGFMIGPAIGGLAATHINLTEHFPQLAHYGLNPFSGAALVSFCLSLVSLVWISLFFPETLAPELRRPARISINPLSNLHIEKGPSRKVTLVNFTFLIAFSGMEFTLVFLALERLNYGPKENISIFIFAGLVMSIFQGFFTRGPGSRIEEKKMALCGILLGLAGMLILAFAMHTLSFFTGVFLKAVGMALVAPSLTSLLTRYTPADKQGSAMGTFRAFGSLARAFGPLFAGLLYWLGGSQITYTLSATLLVLPLYLSWRLPKPTDITNVSPSSLEQ